MAESDSTSVLAQKPLTSAYSGCGKRAEPVQTTHVGSLPRPKWLVPIVRGDEEPPADFAEKLHQATVDVMRKQLDVGLDIINDGELARKDYVTAAQRRLSGFDGKAAAPSAADLVENTEYSDKLEGRKGLLTLTSKTEVKNDACSGVIEYTEAGLADLKEEIARVKAAAEEVFKAKGLDPEGKVFFSSPSPGTLATFFGNDIEGGSPYKTDEEFVTALGKAMATEYKAIQDAGLILQVDCPDLAMGRHTKHKDKNLEDFKKAAQLQVSVMNKALEGLDSSKIRMHVCWGNYPGPHNHDVELKEIAQICMSASPKYLSIEACNPGHAHEWEDWKNVVVPAGKVFMPGTLDTTTSHVEAKKTVAQRCLQYLQSTNAESVGLDTTRVIACTDCGFSTAAGAMNVPEEIVWKKISNMVEGAKLVAPAASEAVEKAVQEAEKKPWTAREKKMLFAGLACGAVGGGLLYRAVTRAGK